MPHSATAALGALSLHPAPLMQGSDSPSAGGMGRKGRHRQAPGLLFFTLRKNAGEGGEGRKEANSSLFATTAALPKEN